MKIAIIGGGMAGLGAAYEFAKNNISDITVFEKSPGLGGLASTVTISGEPLEVFYHHMFPTYYEFLTIAEELGIKDKIFFRRARSGIFLKGEIFPFDTPFDLLKFSPLGFGERLRTGSILAKLKFRRNWGKFEGMRAEEWLRFHFGDRIYSILWEPLLNSKFGQFSKDVGMTWFWGRIHERPSRFGYFRGSFKILIDAIAKHIGGKGMKFVLGRGVEKIEKREEGGFTLTTSRVVEIFDLVVVAAPPIPFLKIASNLLPPDFAKQLYKFKYLGTICAILILKRHFSNFYWLNINEKNFPFLGVIEQSNFVSPEVYGGYY